MQLCLPLPQGAAEMPSGNARPAGTQAGPFGCLPLSGDVALLGVCVDTACTLGICAERSAMFNMITNGENRIKRVLAIRSGGKSIPPCGACRELMTQLMPKTYRDIEVMMDYDSGKVTTLGSLTPDWWI